MIYHLTEHENAITSLISFNNILASASLDKSIKILSFSYKQLIETELVHNKTITAICVLENGFIATGSDDTTIKIWKKNNNSLELMSTLTEHTEKVNALILLKNNSLVSGSFDKTIKVWNQKNENTFECVATLNQSLLILSLAISGSRLLMIGLDDGTIQIRNQTSFVILQTLKGNSEYVWSIILLNNENLASGAFKEISIWKKNNETLFSLSKTLDGHLRTVTSLAVLPNNMFASASTDNSIRIWKQTTFECIYVLNALTDFDNS